MYSTNTHIHILNDTNTLTQTWHTLLTHPSATHIPQEQISDPIHMHIYHNTDTHLSQKYMIYMTYITTLHNSTYRQKPKIFKIETKRKKTQWHIFSESIQDWKLSPSFTFTEHSFSATDKPYNICCPVSGSCTQDLHCILMLSGVMATYTPDNKTKKKTYTPDRYFSPLIERHEISR